MKKVSFIMCALSLILSSLAIALSFHNYKAKSIVTFDEKATIQSFVRQLSIKGTSPEKSKALSHRFKLSLKNALSQIQSQKNVVILKPTEVISGAKDITQDIQNLISTKMIGGGK